MNTPHTATSFDTRLWDDPQQFDPERYKSVPTSAEIDEAKCKQIGLPRCPFEIKTLPLSDGRKTGITNSGFGTVFAVADGKPLPVCDYAGFAPFGFGYRRCPGEQLTKSTCFPISSARCGGTRSSSANSTGRIRDGSRSDRAP